MPQNFLNEGPAWKDVMSQSGLDDMTLLSKLTNEQIMQNLKERFDNGIIYTNIGEVLISMNPYQWLQIFGPEIIQSYVGKARIELPPHIYGVAEQAYRTMVNERENQCILITGESGAGKTEAAKKVMEYISEVSGSASSSAKLDHIKKIILGTNPLLEAFGNAKTLRNNNSSRFGKYFEIHFNQEGEPLGGRIINYLLEKSRVVTQLEGERNFHIFYQFCVGAQGSERQDFGVHEATSFDYLVKGNTTTVDGMDDMKEYQEMREAMGVIGLSPEEQQDIFRLVAAILWIGNIDFTEASERASVADMAVLEFVSSLLGIPASFLKTALEIREMETKHGMARGTTYKVPLNYIQACATRDALSKAIYSAMFDWLVMRINKALDFQAGNTLSIGVLDIYGFEVFKKNVFEQFCINYVNEKLQQIFIEFTLRLEQEEYVKEGIAWTPIEFFNNKIVCDLIEAKRPPGIFLVLDDVCKSVHGVAKGADKAFGDRLSSCASNPHFKLRGNAFCVKHYAGDVTYECEGMPEKNKDTMAKDLFNCIEISTNKYLQTLFPQSERPVAGSKKAPTTSGFKIRTAANELVSTLSKATPHYCRCLKPNDEKRYDMFDGPRVLHQIRYLGLLDNIKVKRAGFAYRTVYKKFLDRYFLLSPQTSYAAKMIWKGDVLSGCKAILADCPFGSDQYQIGKTKVFIRTPESLFALEDLRVNYYHNMVSKIKFAFRTWKNHKHECSTRIKNAFKAYKIFQQQCATIIQKCYKDYKNVAPYSDLRMKIEPNIVNKKERNRLSIASVRKFYGDYLNIMSGPRANLRNAMGPTFGQEKVIFTSKSMMVHHPGLLKANKLSPRFLVLTDAALYLVSLQKKKGVPEYKLDKRFIISSITGCALSPYRDNFVILKMPLDFLDVVLEVEFKTELLGWLKERGSLSQFEFGDKLPYFKKKKSKNKITFIRDDMVQDALYKKDKVRINGGLPASSQPASFQKTGFKFIGVGGGGGPRGGRGGPPRGGRGGAPRGRGGPRGGAPRGGPPRGGPPTRGRGGGPPPVAAPPPKPKCRALYPYDPVEPDELRLQEGDVIEITEEDGDWWKGVLNGAEGLFPANYVEKI